MSKGHTSNVGGICAVRVVLCFAVVVSLCLIGCRKPQGHALPPIAGLEELALQQVADFTDRPEIASAAWPIVSSGDDVFFYDGRLNQLFKTGLDGGEILPVGRSGEGPGEYSGIIGLLLEKENLYILDSRRKVVCMDTAGRPVWEERLVSDFTGLIGKKGDALYFTEWKSPGKGQFKLGLTEWIRAKGARVLCEKPIVTARGAAIYQGRIIEGGGIFTLANPAFAMTGKGLIVSASDKYEFHVMDFDGHVLRTHAFDAPDPDMTKAFEGFKDREGLKNYAIARILPSNGDLWVVSHYYLENRPRIDRFSLSGDLVSSHILPLEFNPPQKDIVIQGEYLFYIDRDESGFRAFSLIPSGS